MNIKLDNGIREIEEKPLQSLNEAEQDIIQEKVDIPQQRQVEQVLSTKSKRFEFTSGAFMGALNSDVNELKFGLRWHAENTQNFEEFLESVSNFVSSSNIELTDTDKRKLKQHYNKYWNK